MLPLGYQKPPNGSPWPRANGLTTLEQQTLMTLWAITRAPLIYGGRLDNMTKQTVQLCAAWAVPRGSGCRGSPRASRSNSAKGAAAS